MIRQKVAVVVATVTIVGLAASSAFAAKPSDNPREGWNNNATAQAAKHVGPPGHSVNPGLGQEIWFLIWNFVQNLFKTLFPWW